jgi:lysophospholipase L1-like esterase
MSRFNDACREVATRQGALLLEWAEHPATGEPANRSRDGFHPSPEGHRKAAAEVVRQLERRLRIRTRREEEDVA